MLELADRPWVGQPLRRLEDRRLVTGRGTYVADIRLAGMKEVAFLRSPYAHARVLGVVAPAGKEGCVFAHADLGWIKPLDPCISLDGYTNLVVPPLPARVRYVGDLLAAVVAGDPYEADDLLHAVRVEFEELPGVASPADAHKASLYEEVPGNVVFEQRFSHGLVDERFRDAPHLFRRTFRKGRVSAAPLEARGVVASLDPGSGTLTVWSSTQTPHELRTLLAQALDRPERSIRVIAPDVGGGFGMKSVLFREEILVAALAIQLRTPLRWIEDRRESLSASTHARDNVVDLRWAVDGEGRVLALDADIVSDVGAHPVYPVSLAMEPLGIAKLLPGPYKIVDYRYRATAVLTNKCPIAPYRGVYMPSSTYVMERVMDITARELGSDPITVRRRNLVTAEDFPWVSVTGIGYQRASMEHCLSAIGDVVAEQRRLGPARTGDDDRVLHGLGVANFIELTASGSKAFHGRGMVKVPGYDSAEARIYPDGSLEVAVSGSSHGQGHRTALAQLAADVFGIAPEQVEIVQSDTSRCPYGMGTYASRGAVVVGGAVLEACRGLKTKLLEKAAAYLEANRDDLVMAEGLVKVRGSARHISLGKLAAYVYGMHADGAPHEMTAVHCKHMAVVDPPQFTVSNGAHLARVEVDRETARVRVTGYWVVEDCGRMINPLIVAGQIHGGVAQGLGEAVLEELVYDENAQLVTSTWMEYGMPAASDVPFVSVQHHENPCPETVGGFKGMGEAGTIGAAAAVANAVEDAIGSLGVALNEVPLSRPRLFALLRNGSAPPSGAGTRP